MSKNEAIQCDMVEIGDIACASHANEMSKMTVTDLNLAVYCIVYIIGMYAGNV